MFRKLQYIAYAFIIGQLIVRIFNRMKQNMGRADDYLE